MNCETIECLIERVNVWTGMSGEEPEQPDLSKLKDEYRDYVPGCRIRIEWKSGYAEDGDEGYIFTYPDLDWNDVFMTGIVHVPKPCGCEKGDCDPIWIHFSDLISLKNVDKISLI